MSDGETLPHKMGKPDACLGLLIISFVLSCFMHLSLRTFGLKLYTWSFTFTIFFPLVSFTTFPPHKCCTALFLLILISKVFGCLCYPNTSSTMPHKLSPRSKPCVFLRYPTSHRGYCCLDLDTNKVIISRHVTFDESVFPYSAIHSTKMADYAFLDNFEAPPILAVNSLTPAHSLTFPTLGRPDSPNSS